MSRRAVLLALSLLAACGGAPGAAEAPTLLGRAILPAATLAAGPPAGARLGDAALHGQTPPFAGQPAQGFSALIAGEAGAVLALVDNGFGTLENSADFLLRVYTLTIDPRR